MIYNNFDNFFKIVNTHIVDKRFFLQSNIIKNQKNRSYIKFGLSVKKIGFINKKTQSITNINYER